MITAELLTDLARQYLLREDETVEWSKVFPEGPTVHLQTAERGFTARVAHGLLLVEREPWVEAVIELSRKDRGFAGLAPRELLLMTGDAGLIRLADAGQVAALGQRLPAGTVDPLAYAELLVQGQWAGGWSKLVVTDPAAWRGHFPAQAALPPVGEVRVRDEGGVLDLTFTASREYAQVAGGRSVLDVAEWTVRAPAGAPATWRRRPVAEAVPVSPPW